MTTIENNNNGVLYYNQLITYILNFLEKEYQQIFRQVARKYRDLFNYNPVNWKNFSVCHSVAYVRKYGFVKSVETIDKTIRLNDIVVLKYLKKKGCPVNFNNFCTAVEVGNLACVKTLWLFKYRFVSTAFKQKAMCLAVRYNHLNVVKWLYNNKFTLDEKVFEEASRNGNFELINWLFNNNCPYDELCCKVAAEVGNLETLIWLRNNQFPWNSETFNSAALNGNLTNMKWLRENGCPWDKLTCLNASENLRRTCEFNFSNAKKLSSLPEASNENAIKAFNNVKWLHENGCPWDSRSFNKIIRSGNLDYVLYFYNNNCPHNPDSFNYATDNFNPRLFNWMKEKKFLNSTIFSNSALQGNLDVLIWLKNNGCPWDARTFTAAARNGNLEILKWLKYNNCPWDDQTLVAAAAENNASVVEWLILEGCPFNLVIYSIFKGKLKYIRHLL